MIADSAILPPSFTARYLNSDSEYIECTYTKNDVRQDRVGVSDTTCDMSWWESGDGDGSNRFIAQYLAQNITNLPSAASARRISIDIPVYMRNVKYLDICFCVWIDLGYARGASLASYNDVSALAYVKGSDDLNLYCIPTPGNDHPGTGRLNIQGSPGFVPFRFFYDDEDNPANIDFIRLEFAGGYSEQNQLNVWISQPCYNEDIIFSDDPHPIPQEGEWGPESDRAGGDGGFDDTSDNRGDLTGTTISISIEQQADIVNKNLQAGGFHVYKLDDGAMAQISRVLFSQSYFGLLTVSRYNPLSAILSYHLLPAVFVPLTYNGSPQTEAVKAGGYNFNTDPDTPVQVPRQSIIDTVSHWHVGSVDLAPYFGAFPDFAPYTAIKVHLPYVGEIMIDTNKVMHGSLAVDYTCDVLNGNVCAYVTCVDRKGHTEQVYTATGNAAYSLPIFSESQSGAAVGKLISSGVQSVFSAAGGNPTSMIGEVAGIAEAAAFGVQHSPQVHGSFGGNVGMIGDTVCWLEIIRPQWVEPANFRQLHGIPSGIAGTLEITAASGFVQLQSIETDGIAGATEQELEEIVKTMKAGIYIGGVQQ